MTTKPSIAAPQGSALSRDELRKLARRAIDEAADRAGAYAHAVRPIYGATAEGRPEHIGSSILVDASGTKLIITAAHVIDWNDQSSLYVGLAATELLDAEFIMSVAPNDNRDSDAIDFAVARFPEGLLAALGDATFIPETMIGVPDDPSRHYFTCIGFPNSQNKKPAPRARTMRPRRRCYTSVGRPASILPNWARDDTHVLVDFNSKFSRNSTGERLHSGKPVGMSGGAIFDVGPLGALANLLVPASPRLAALFIEGHRDEKVLMGTRIDQILATLREQAWL